MARREIDSAYRWIGRSEMALSEEGILIETGAPDQWANSFLRPTFDNGLAGWSTSVPAGASIAAETTVDNFYLGEDVTTKNVLMTQASPAATDNYLYQTFSAIAAWIGLDMGPRCFGVAARCTTGTEVLSLVMRRSSDNNYYNWVSGTWQAALDANCYWDFTPSSGAPSFHWNTVDLGTVAAGETYTPRIVQKAGIASGAQHQVYYAEFSGPYPMSPVYHGASYGEGRRWDNLWIPNFAGARCFPADHHTLSGWFRPWWDLTDDLESPGAVTWGLQQHFGLFCCWHDEDNFVELIVDQPDAEMRLTWRAGGTDYTITAALTSFGRDDWAQVGVRKIGTEGELDKTAHTVELFLNGASVGSVTAAALVEDDHSIFLPGAGHDYSFAAGLGDTGYPLNLNGSFRQLRIRYDCFTDAEIAALYAVGPGGV